MAQLLAERRRVDRGFERLYRRHVAYVYHYALAVLRNPADAEDVTQTTFLNALRAYERGERPKAEQNWLIAIAHNVCRQRFRQSQRRPREVSLDEDVAGRVVDDEAPTAEDIRRALGQRGRDAPLPGAAGAAGAARGHAHLPAGGARDLEAARRAPRAERARRPAGAPPRLPGVRDRRQAPARPAERLQVTGRGPAPDLARLALRRRGRRGGRHRRCGEGCRGRRDRRPR